MPRHHGRANLNPNPWQNGVAEGCVGSCRRDLLDHIIRPERAPPQAASRRIHVLLSRRPYSSRPPQGNSWPQNLFCSHRSGDLPCAIGRFAPSLRPRSLRSADSHWLTPLETSVTSSPSNKEPSLRVSICALGLNPSRVENSLQYRLRAAPWILASYRGSFLIPTTGTFSKASDQAAAAGTARLESLWRVVLNTSA